MTTLDDEVGFIEMDEEKWAEHFIPYYNPEDGGESMTFDMYSHKQKGFLRFMREFYPEHVWSIVGTDDLYITNGHHWVNHVAYAITEKPRTIFVYWSSYNLHCTYYNNFLFTQHNRSFYCFSYYIIYFKSLRARKRYSSSCFLSE